MAIYLNQVTVIGNLTADPEIKVTQNGKSLCNFSIAINKKTLNNENKPIYIKVVAWASSADFLKRFMKKGSAVLVQGELDINSYTDGNGNKRYDLFINARSCGFGGDRPSESQPNSAPYSAPKQEFQEIAPDDDLPF